MSKSWQSLISDDCVRDQQLPLIVSGDSNSTLIDCCNGLLLTYHLLPCMPPDQQGSPFPSQILPKKSQVSTITFDPCHSQHFRVVIFTNWQDQGAGLKLFVSYSPATGSSTKVSSIALHSPPLCVMLVAFFTS